MESLVREGRALRFVDVGQGEPLIFVHGWSCNHRSFLAQIDHFAGTHRVIAPDLRGHGSSDKATSYTIDDFADDLTWLARELELVRPILIGHSMGGLIVVEAAASHPDVFAAAVTLDAPLMDLPELRAAMAMQVELFRGPRREEDGPAMLRAGLVGPYDDDAIATEHLAEMMLTPPDVSVPALESVIDWTTRRRLLDCTQPMLCVHIKGGGPTDPTQFASGRPNVFVAQTIGAGHFIQGQVPDQVNAMIERFLHMVATSVAA